MNTDRRTSATFGKRSLSARRVSDSQYAIRIANTTENVLTPACRNYDRYHCLATNIAKTFGLQRWCCSPRKIRRRNARKLLNSCIKLTTKSGQAIKTNPPVKCNCLIFVQTGGREVLVPIFFFREEITRSFEMDVSNSQDEKILCHDVAFWGGFIL